MSPVLDFPYPAAMPSSTPRRLTLVLATALAVAVGALVPAVSGVAPAAAATTLTLDPVVTTGVVSPIAMATRAGSTDLFVAERTGKVRVLHQNAGVITVDPTPLLDITAYISTAPGDGLYGLTFDPTGARLYVHYTNPAGNNRLVEYTMTNNGTGPAVNLATRRVVLGVPQVAGTYHKGGDLSFGPDDRLYLAIGDGDVNALENPPILAQDRRSLLGKILRINPRATATRPYTNPAANPFVGRGDQRGEIWLYGVRNPWRFSFDRATGDLYVADVGEHTTEEVNVLLADSNGHLAGRGANLGWSRMEGVRRFNGALEPANHSRPAFTYPHLNGDCSVIGGYVYRGTAIPDLVGTYLYGDRCTGRIGGLVLGGAPAPETTSYSTLGINAGAGVLQSFGQGPDGELYLLTGSTTTGTIYRIEPAAP
jgi:glucose/arabinose dehydrogenase